MRQDTDFLFFYNICTSEGQWIFEGEKNLGDILVWRLKAKKHENLVRMGRLPDRVKRSPFMLHPLLQTETSGVHFRKTLSEETAPGATLDQSYNCNHNNCTTKTNEKLYWNSSLKYSWQSTYSFHAVSHQSPKKYCGSKCQLNSLFI